jgi:hypothetical protein
VVRSFLQPLRKVRDHGHGLADLLRHPVKKNLLAVERQVIKGHARNGPILTSVCGVPNCTALPTAFTGTAKECRSGRNNRALCRPYSSARNYLPLARQKPLHTLEPCRIRRTGTRANGHPGRVLHFLRAPEPASPSLTPLVTMTGHRFAVGVLLIQFLLFFICCVGCCVGRCLRFCPRRSESPGQTDDFSQTERVTVATPDGGRQSHESTPGFVNRYATASPTFR